MKPVPFVLALFLAESLGFPQVPPTGQDATALPDQSTGLVSPWSQWMSLKAPPISLAKPKKKLLPGPPPPEGTPEAPWVTWTRMKVSTALAPPLPPPPPPPSPVESEGGVSSTTGNASTPEQAVWIQWTQMKLPLATPLAPASPAQETPWDAWTKLKSPIAQAQSGAAPGPSPSKRMAPDRYSIASTIAPRVINWPPQQQTSSSSELGSGRVPLSRGPVSIQPPFLDAVPPNQPSSSVSVKPATTESDIPTNLAALVESTPELARLPPKIRNQVLEELGLLSQSSPISTTTPVVSRVPSRQLTVKPDISAILSALPPSVLKQLLATTSPVEVEKLIEAIAETSSVNNEKNPPPPAAGAPAVLSIIPEPVRSQILVKATTAELAQIVDVLSKLEDVTPEERLLVQNVNVGTIIPASLVQKLPPTVAPLLTKKLKIPSVPPTVLLSSSIPEPILSTILSVANPLEVVELTENVKKVQELAPVSTPSIAALLPSTLAAKLPPQLGPVLGKIKLEKIPVPTSAALPAEITTVLTALPAPVLNEILAEATPAELTKVVENVLKLEEVKPPPKIPVVALLPPSLIPKLSPASAPLLTKEVVLSPLPAAPTEVPVEVLSVLSSIPEPLLKEILTAATSEELIQLLETISSVESPAPEKKPISALIPPSLFAKLPGPVTPLVNIPIEIPAKLVTPDSEGVPVNAIPALLSILPESVVPIILSKATPEELTELINTVAKLDAVGPVAKPLISNLEVATIIPPTLLAKLPPAATPLLEKKIDVEAFIGSEILPSVIPPIPESTASVLSILPPAIIPSLITKATQEELTELVERVEKLEALPKEEKELISKVEVAAILPPSLLPKLPPAVAPLLAKTIDIADLTLPVTKANLTPVTVPLVPPTTATVLSILPPLLIPQIISEATPEELTELVERVEKLKAIPEEEKALLPSVQVAAILPPSLITKLPVEATPLLQKGVTISELPPTIPPPPPIPVGVAPPSTVPPTLLDVLSVLPAPVVPEILAKATPEELTELATSIAQLESIPEEQIQLLPTIKVAAVLPPTLLAKLSPETLPLLGKEIVLPLSATTPTATVAPSPVPAALPAAVLSLLPKPVETEILTKATPDELTELINTVEALEAIPTEALPKLTLGNILPPTLIPKLSPAVLPLLSKEVPIPSPELAPAAPGLSPPPETEAIPPELKSIPEPLLSTILAVATPAELKEIEKIIQKIEAIPPEQKAVLPKLPIASVLPATLLPKLPPTVAPLLSLELIPPNTIQVPVEVPVLQAVPEPLLSEILAVASPSEVEQIVETLTELEELPPQQKALLPKPLTITAILPPTLIAKLPSEIVPLINKDVIPEAVQVTPEAVSAPPSVAPAAPLPETGEAPWLEYLKSIYGIPETTPEVITPAPPVQSTEVPPTKAEEKLLTKWAKIILDKTGNTAVPVPGEIPPLQAAWMEWIQLQMNETKKAEATTSESPVLPVSSEESTTEYPWTKWLKLKSSTPPAPLAIRPGAPVPPLDVGTDSPEKATLDWLEALEKAQETPAVVPPPQITPEMEEKVVERLKQLGIENVPLPPDQIQALVSALAAGAVPPVLPPVPSEVVPSTSEALPPPPNVPVTPSRVPPPFPPAAYPAYLPQPSPFYPLVPRPFWAQPPYMPYMGVPPPNPLVPAEAAPSPVEKVPEVPSTVNLTQYLIANKQIPAGLPPSAPIPIPALTETTEENASESKEVVESTPRTITSQELAALTPTKFAALLKEILKDCNNTNILVTRSTHSKGKGGATTGGGFNWMAMKNKYKPSFAGPPQGVMSKRALMPIPSQGVSAPPPQLEASSSKDLLPLPSLSMPKVETAGTVLDPAYWAAQKSMFLSKLFSTLAKVALNDSAAQQETSTLSPKEQLTKQVNTLLLNSMTRSVKHQQETEEEDEYESSDEDQQNVDENELVTNDNSEPNLPKEPENPLHKLFKFGVQKTVLSDLSTPPPEPQPIYVYVTSPPPPLETATTPNLDKQKEMLNKLKKVYDENKKLKKKIKSKNRKYKSKTTSSSKYTGGSNTHHHSRNHPFRKTTTASPATTESPVDFELLAKALLVDNKAKK